MNIPRNAATAAAAIVGRRSQSRRRTGAIVDRLESRAYLSATFTMPTFNGGVGTPSAIASGDFNADGFPDIVVAGTSPTASVVPVVGVYLNKAGAYGTPTLLPFNGSAGGVGVGDFNGDGKQDIAVVNSTGNGLDVFLGSGDGNFTPGVGSGLSGATGDTSLAVADFNGDHKDDIAVVNPASNLVETQFGKGNSSFAAETSVSVPSPRKVIAVDLNADGHPDLVVATATGAVYVALNSGMGTFATPVSYNAATAITTFNDLAVADLNGDTLPDVIVVGDNGSGAAAGTASVLLNIGGGTFGAASAIATSIDPALVVIGSLSDSGQKDIGIISPAGALQVLPGVGNGTFGDALTVFATELGAPGPQALAIDVNSNNAADIEYLSPSGTGFGLALNKAGTTVTPVTITSPLIPAVVGKLPTTPLVAGGKIKTIREIVSVTNGSAAAVSGKVTVNLVLATTPAGEAGDPVVGTVTRNLSINVQKSKKLSIPVSALPGGLAGNYYIVAQLTDGAGKTNHSPSAATVSIVAPTIDLSGAFAVTPTVAKVGKKASFTFSITNTGTITAVESLPVQIQTSDIPGIDSTSAVIDSFTKKVSIKPGKTIKLRVSKIVSSTAGSFYVVVQLDPASTLPDTRPSNNFFATVSPVVVG